MKTKYLFPARFKKIGWVVLIPTLIAGLFTLILEWEPKFLDVSVFGLLIDNTFGTEKTFGLVENNILNEILGILVILSGLLVAFSRESEEDELISKIRLESLVWATYCNYGILLLAFAFLYDFSFYWVMVVNMFTLLLLFILKFQLSLLKLRKSIGHEE